MRYEGDGMKRRMLFLLPLILIVCLPARATDRFATSCSRTAVVTAINSAVTGDRVIVPTCSATGAYAATATQSNTCHWSLMIMTFKGVLCVVVC